MVFHKTHYNGAPELSHVLLIFSLLISKATRLCLSVSSYLPSTVVLSHKSTTVILSFNDSRWCYLKYKSNLIRPPSGWICLVFDSRETRKTSEPVYIIMIIKEQTLLNTFLFGFHCFLALEASTENLSVIWYSNIALRTSRVIISGSCLTSGSNRCYYMRFGSPGFYNLILMARYHWSMQVLQTIVSFYIQKHLLAKCSLTAWTLNEQICVWTPALIPTWQTAFSWETKSNVYFLIW